MNYWKKLLTLLIGLSMIFGCTGKLSEVAISGKVRCLEDAITSIKVVCFIYDAADNRIDTKTITINRGENQYIFDYAFNVPPLSQIVLNASAVTPENRLYRVVSEKIKMGRKNVQRVNLFMEEAKTTMDEYRGDTINVSGSITCDEYRGLVDIRVITQEDQKKLKYKGDLPHVTARKSINISSGLTYFDINIPVNLGPSTLCIFKLDKIDTPRCEETDIGTSDIKDIKLAF